MLSCAFAYLPIYLSTGMVDEEERCALVMRYYRNGSVSEVFKNGKYETVSELSRLKYALQVSAHKPLCTGLSRVLMLASMQRITHRGSSLCIRPPASHSQHKAMRQIVSMCCSVGVIPGRHWHVLSA